MTQQEIIDILDKNYPNGLTTKKISKLIGRGIPNTNICLRKLYKSRFITRKNIDYRTFEYYGRIKMVKKNPAYYCICGKYLGHRGFCSKECHDKYYDREENAKMC